MTDNYVVATDMLIKIYTIAEKTMPSNGSFIVRMNILIFEANKNLNIRLVTYVHIQIMSFYSQIF